MIIGIQQFFKNIEDNLSGPAKEFILFSYNSINIIISSMNSGATEDIVLKLT